MGKAYRWHQTYFAAISEIDEAQLSARIHEARSAIEERLLSPVDTEEFAAIEKAQQALQLLWKQHEQRKGPSY